MKNVLKVVHSTAVTQLSTVNNNNTRKIFLNLFSVNNNETRNISEICSILTIIRLDIAEVYNLSCSKKENFNMMRN